MKNVCLQSYSGPHFSAFGLNTEGYSVSLRIQSECGKMWTRITPNAYTFYAVYMTILFIKLLIVFPHNLLRKYFHLKALFKIYEHIVNSKWLPALALSLFHFETYFD